MKVRIIDGGRAYYLCICAGFIFIFKSPLGVADERWRAFARVRLDILCARHAGHEAGLSVSCHYMSTPARGLRVSSELFIPRGCFMNNIIYIVGVVVIVIAVLSFFGFR